MAIIGDVVVVADTILQIAFIHHDTGISQASRPSDKFLIGLLRLPLLMIWELHTVANFFCRAFYDFNHDTMEGCGPLRNSETCQILSG